MEMTPEESMLSDHIIVPYAYDFKETLEDMVMQMHSMILHISKNIQCIEEDIRHIRYEMECNNEEY